MENRGIALKEVDGVAVGKGVTRWSISLHVEFADVDVF